MNLINEKKEYIIALDAKLSNTAFTKNAPEKIIRIEMDKKNLFGLFPNSETATKPDAGL